MKKNRMFHGTWGYLYPPDPELFTDCDPADFTPQSYRRALLDVSNMQINAELFTPNNDDCEHFASAIKSQMTRVLIQYVASNSASNSTIPRDPAQVDPMKPKLPNITMLKLMIASDNTSDGIADELDGIIQQTDLKKKDVFSKLLIL